MMLSLVSLLRFQTWRNTPSLPLWEVLLFLELALTGIFYFFKLRGVIVHANPVVNSLSLFLIISLFIALSLFLFFLDLLTLSISLAHSCLSILPLSLSVSPFILSLISGCDDPLLSYCFGKIIMSGILWWKCPLKHFRNHNEQIPFLKTIYYVLHFE